MGKILDRMIRPNDLSLCKFYNEDQTGHQLSNGSYDGAIGQIEKGFIDMFLKPELPFLDSDLIDFTPVIRPQDYLLGHNIDEKPRSQQMDREMFLESVDFIYLGYSLMALIGFFCLTILFFYWKMSFDSRQQTRRLRRSTNLVLSFIIDDYIDRVSYKALILFFFVTYMFMTKQFLSNNIKTTKVIVDTSTMITDEEALFRSSRKAAWMEGERDIDIARTSPKGTFLYNLYKFKNENPPYCFSKIANPKMIEKISKIFTMMSGVLLIGLARFSADMFEQNFFINMNPFYSTYNVIYRKKEKSEKMKHIDNFATSMFESGIIEKSMDEGKNLKFIQNAQTKSKVYYDTNSYIDDNTLNEAINFDNFYYVFMAFFGILLTILIIFSAHHLINFILFKLNESENSIKIEFQKVQSKPSERFIKKISINYSSLIINTENIFKIRKKKINKFRSASSLPRLKRASIDYKTMRKSAPFINRLNASIKLDAKV